MDQNVKKYKFYCLDAQHCILNDRRESLTEENTKRLVLLYYNGDIEGHFN